MRKIFTIFAISVLASIVFFGLTGCGGTESSGKGSEPASNTASAAPSTGEAPAKSEYPPIASAVANSDLKNLDGTTFKVADRKGKVVLLNMWATWCGPCRAEMPSLVKMQDEHRDSLEIIGLNTDDETVEDINEFAADMNLNYTLVWADTDLQAELVKISKFPGIPQSFLIDRHGNLRGVFRGANPADIKKMEELVAKVVAES